YQHHDLYTKYQAQDSEISGLLGECGLKGERANETGHLPESNRQDHCRSGARRTDMAQAMVRRKHGWADHQAAAP
ncbi:hypothetical protein ACROSR_07355, partial [Roseovarius tibetensis]